MDLQQMIAEFQKKGGEIKRVPCGKRAMSEREIYLAAHASAEEVRLARVEKAFAQPAPQVRVITDHAGREFYLNEQGEWL